tara:strand:+ start:41 stop:193 length:153 start_codon:yes stop_codon:yes gene_type:complete
METLYSVQQFATQGWTDVSKNLTKEDASKRLNALISEGFNPKDLKVVRET